MVLALTFLTLLTFSLQRAETQCVAKVSGLLLHLPAYFFCKDAQKTVSNRNGLQPQRFFSYICAVVFFS